MTPDLSVAHHMTFIRIDIIENVTGMRDAGFLEGRWSFGTIPRVIPAALDAIPTQDASSINDVMEADRATRRWIHDHHVTPTAGSGR